MREITTLLHQVDQPAQVNVDVQRVIVVQAGRPTGYTPYQTMVVLSDLASVWHVFVT